MLDYRRDCAAPAAHFFFNPVLLSLSCVQTFSANDTATKRKRALSVVWTKVPFNRIFNKPQGHTGHRLKAYAPFRTLSRLLWRLLWHGRVTERHCLFDVMRQDKAEDQACGICQPWGIKGGRARPSFVVSNGGFRGKKSKSSQGRAAWETYGFAAWRQNCLHRKSRCMCETAARRRRQTLCLARRRNNGIRACSGFCGVCFPAPPGLKRLFGFFHLCVCTFSASRA